MKHEAIGLQKVAGAENPADFDTKHLNADAMKRHLERLGVKTGGGRARSAPMPGVLGHRGIRKVWFRVTENSRRDELMKIPGGMSC